MDRLRVCTKSEECFELDNNVTPVLKFNKKVSFVAIKQMNYESDILERKKTESLKK